MAVLKRVCDDRHRSIRELNPDVPDWLEAVIDRLLAKDPADRFQTATEVADLLERGLAHVQQPTAVPRPVVPGVPGPSIAEAGFRSARRQAPATVPVVSWPWPRALLCWPSRAWAHPRRRD